MEGGRGLWPQRENETTAPLREYDAKWHPHDGWVDAMVSHALQQQQQPRQKSTGSKKKEGK